MEPLGGAAKVQGVGHRQKIAQVTKFNAGQGGHGGADAWRERHDSKRRAGAAALAVGLPIQEEARQLLRLVMRLAQPS